MRRRALAAGAAVITAVTLPACGSGIPTPAQSNVAICRALHEGTSHAAADLRSALAAASAAERSTALYRDSEKLLGDSRSRAPAERVVDDSGLVEFDCVALGLG